VHVGDQSQLVSLESHEQTASPKLGAHNLAQQAASSKYTPLSTAKHVFRPDLTVPAGAFSSASTVTWGGNGWLANNTIASVTDVSSKPLTSGVQCANSADDYTGTNVGLHRPMVFDPTFSQPLTLTNSSGDGGAPKRSEPPSCRTLQVTRATGEVTDSFKSCKHKRSRANPASHRQRVHTDIVPSQAGGEFTHVATLMGHQVVVHGIATVPKAKKSNAENNGTTDSQQRNPVNVTRDVEAKHVAQTKAASKFIHALRN
jgi:hypothetical protein